MKNNLICDCNFYCVSLCIGNIPLKLLVLRKKCMFSLHLDKRTFGVNFLGWRRLLRVQSQFARALYPSNMHTCVVLSGYICGLIFGIANIEAGLEVIIETL